MKYPQVEWLIKGEPREVQLEALRRSYYGYKLRESRDGEELYTQSKRGHTPARGWGHLMEMRLGKTPTILNEFSLFNRDFGFKKLVVFAPNSYKEDWTLEAEKYGLPVPAWAYEQGQRGQAHNFIRVAKGSCALIVNYEALIYDETREFLSGFVDNLTVVAADESIRLKNPNGLFYEGAMLTAKNAAVTRIASGMPFTQGPQDFYPQARFIRMYDGYDFFAYRNKFCKMGGFKSKKIVGVKNEEILQSHIDANSFVAKRKDWGNQTPAEYFNLRLEMDPVQKKHYREIDKEFITWLDDGTEVSAVQVVTKLMKLQQISSGFAYTEDGRAVEIMDPKKTPKMKRLVEFIEEELTGKLVVPYYYGKSGDVLLESLAKYKPAIIRGDQWMRDNERDTVSEKARFNNDPECRVMILQLSAGKYGHDLSGNTGDRCATMVFYENSYSLDDRGQIEARNTTAFQDWSNYYFDMVSSPVEGKAIDALIRKESMVEAVLGVYREGKTRVDVA